MRLNVPELERELYLGHLPGPCSYLPDRFSNLLFLDGTEAANIYEQLLAVGYRRYGGYVYRPDCSSCSECRVLRVPVRSFRPTRSQRRVQIRGSGIFRAELGEPEYTDEKAELYARYLAHQHRRSKEETAAEPEEADSSQSESTYRSFFVETLPGLETIELRLYSGDRLAGVGIIDKMADALSAVYFYFEPDFSRFSPGTYSILFQIDLARGLNLKYYYPGYYIRDCAAMNYKLNYRPAQLRTIGEADWEDMPGGADSGRQ